MAERPASRRNPASSTERRNPQDERQVVVSLTEAGREMQWLCPILAEALVAASGMAMNRLEAVARAVRDAIAANAGGWG